MLLRTIVVLLTTLLACTALVSAHPASPIPPTPRFNADSQYPLSALPSTHPPPPPQHHPTHPNIDTNPPRPSPPQQTRLPTRRESTLLARRLLAYHHSGIGYLASSFPPSANLSSDPVYRWTPPTVADTPIALPEYFAGDCDPSDRGDPVLIRLGISTVGKNSRGGSNVSLGVDWWGQPPVEALPGAAAAPPSSFFSSSSGGGGKVWWSRSEAGLPRLSLSGYLEVLTQDEVDRANVVKCFENKHPDARAWRPGSEKGAHSGEWVRLKVQAVYWVGGFGDSAWIGWLDVEGGGGEWAGVKRREWERVRLPGENGWWDMPWFEGGNAGERDGEL